MRANIDRCAYISHKHYPISSHYAFSNHCFFLLKASEIMINFFIVIFVVSEPHTLKTNAVALPCMIKSF